MLQEVFQVTFGALQCCVGLLDLRLEFLDNLGRGLAGGLSILLCLLCRLGLLLFAGNGLRCGCQLRCCAVQDPFRTGFLSLSLALPFALE